MTKENKLQLDTLVDYFNTKWQNVDPETYMSIGFELFKLRFTYRQFLNKKILLHYIQKDKIIKREIGLTQEQIKESVDFIKRYVIGDSIGSKLLRYCSMKDGMMSLPVKHYLENKISKAFIAFIMWYGYYTPTEDELNKMPYVSAHYRDIANNFNKDTIKLCGDIM
jgi:hypothetical protein